MPVGLNATVDLVAGRAENALLVPVEALREIDTDSFAVFVVSSDGSLELRPVKVGLRDLTWAEITSGLRAGEVVSTGLVETGE
jgi:multidrug efflux pump subunit AcrA (membrane-fusion protein)